MKKIISILFLVLLVSGCVGMDPFGFLSPKTEVKEKPEDVISMQNINVLPPPPIIAGDEFSISFDITNLEEEKPVNTGYRVLDTGLCWLVSSTGGFCSGGDLCYNRIRDDCSGETEEGYSCWWDPAGEMFSDFVPGRVEFVEMTFDTPESSRIGYLSTTCPIRFVVGYEFTAVSEIEANVIDDDRYYQLHQSGEFATFTPTLNVGRGPIKIYMEFGASLPIRTSKTLPIYITVQDKGTGLLTEIPEGHLKLEVPEGKGFIWIDCGERFSCSGTTCQNNDDITMIRRESMPIRCTFTTPSEDYVELEQTYFITAYLDYYYEITKQVDVRVEPLEA